MFGILYSALCNVSVTVESGHVVLMTPVMTAYRSRSGSTDYTSG